MRVHSASSSGPWPSPVERTIATSLNVKWCLGLIFQGYSIRETQFQLVPQGQAYAYRHPEPWSDGEEAGAYDSSPYGSGPYAQERGWFDGPRAQAPASRYPEAGPWWEDERPSRPRRIDPDYFWGSRRIY